MSPQSGNFDDPFDQFSRDIQNLSNEDLERLMGGLPPSPTEEGIGATEAGTYLSGVVVDIRGGEILVEIGGKDLGVIDEMEFSEDELPKNGETIKAEFVRYDQTKEAAILTVKGVHKEVAWDSLRVGAVLEGTVVDTNKGGLILDVKGIRAFVPISQIERERVEDLTPYMNRKLVVVVTSLDRGSENLVVSRRELLNVEAEEERGRILATLSEGDALTGTVVRITDHGAFIDLGGTDGLLHASKIRQQLKGEDAKLQVGQRIPVEIVRIDRDRGRIALDFKRQEASTWGQLAEDYEVGDEVTGWVKKTKETGIVLSIDEGIEGFLSNADASSLATTPLPGDIVKAVITAIDSVERTITLKAAR